MEQTSSQPFTFIIWVGSRILKKETGNTGQLKQYGLACVAVLPGQCKDWGRVQTLLLQSTAGTDERHVHADGVPCECYKIFCMQVCIIFSIVNMCIIYYNLRQSRNSFCFDDKIKNYSYWSDNVLWKSKPLRYVTRYGASLSGFASHFS